VRYSSSYSSSQNRLPKVSVVIPTLNEEANIKCLLQDLHKQTIRPFEIIVVDGKSTDKTIKIATSFKDVKTIIVNPDPATQRTIGGKKTRGELLFFMDADVRLKKDFIQNVLQIHQKKQFSVACPFYIPFRSSWIITGMYLFFGTIFYMLQKIQPSGAGSCIIVSKQVFAESGGFNALYRFDDIAFIRNASWNNKFSYLPIAVYVSDRRFKKDGVIRTFLLYLLLSLFFFTYQFKLANKIQYKFDHYKK
jgi:glycosyltransferase involved in cell wall biosynthesis